jgi:hypothetical protein
MPELPSPSHLARVLGVPERTARHWRALGRLPAPWRLLYVVLDGGNIGALDAAWRGWRLIRGELVSPEGLTFRPGEVLSIFVRQQEIGELRRQLADPQQWALLPPAPAEPGAPRLAGPSGE